MRITNGNYLSKLIRKYGILDDFDFEIEEIFQGFRIKFRKQEMLLFIILENCDIIPFPVPKI